MADLPRSMSDSEQRLGDEMACAQYLATLRWPDGFACPGCGGTKARRLETEACTYECIRCGRQTSVTAALNLVLGRLCDGNSAQRHISALQFNLHINRGDAT